VFKGLFDLGEYVLAYGEGQLTILNGEGDVVENVIVELRDSVGAVKWDIENWEPIRVEKKPAPIPSTPYEMVFQNLG